MKARLSWMANRCISKVQLKPAAVAVMTGAKAVEDSPASALA